MKGNRGLAFRSGIGNHHLERKAHEVIRGIGLHLLHLLKDPLYRRVLPVVLLLRH
ncbi:unnamed protein product, partial [Musa hybrid cultivar]